MHVCMSVNICKLILSFIYLFSFQGFSCVDLLNLGMRQSGVYYLQIRGTTYWFLKVFCEQEITEGGWTVYIYYNYFVFSVNI